MGGQGGLSREQRPPGLWGSGVLFEGIVFQLSLSGALPQKGFLHLIRKWNPNGISPHWLL